MNRSDDENEFFLTGAKTYLDVEDAVEEFRRQVQERCGEVVESRLTDICHACDQEWVAEQLKGLSGENRVSQISRQAGGCRRSRPPLLYFVAYRDDAKLAF